MGVTNAWGCDCECFTNGDHNLVVACPSKTRHQMTCRQTSTPNVNLNTYRHTVHSDFSRAANGGGCTSTLSIYSQVCDRFQWPSHTKREAGGGRMQHTSNQTHGLVKVRPSQTFLIFFRSCHSCACISHLVADQLSATLRCPSPVEDALAR